jgi:hypothetical protein
MGLPAGSGSPGHHRMQDLPGAQPAGSEWAKCADGPARPTPADTIRAVANPTTPAFIAGVILFGGFARYWEKSRYCVQVGQGWRRPSLARCFDDLDQVFTSDAYIDYRAVKWHPFLPAACSRRIDPRPPKGKADPRVGLRHGWFPARRLHGGGNRLARGPGGRGGAGVGAQKTASALRAEHLGGLSVEEHRAPGDEHGADGVVVAVDHPR